MKTDYQLDKITKQLLKWYAVNKRNLPWRESADPYSIWLSEIILQQTRVDQGLAYYNRFLKQYPTVTHLARDSQQNVLKLWQGLGYYSRARNLHETAKHVVNQYKSKFPTTYKDLQGLKGVGTYTAAAIASIAFKEPVAVLDGNVYRVLSRYFGIYTPIDTNTAKKEFFELANSLVPQNEPGDYNQAVMDFGAMVCTPRNPSCMSCVLQSRCYAFGTSTQTELPVKAKKTKVRNRHFNYVLVIEAHHLYIRQRIGKDVWQDLFELPLLEEGSSMRKEMLLLGKSLGLKPKEVLKEKVFSTKHILSHQVVTADFFVVRVKKASLKDYKRIKLSDYHKYPVARLTEKFFESPFFNREILKGKKK